MEKRKNGKKKEKINLSILTSVPQHTWPFSKYIQNLNLALIEAEKSVTEIFIGEKETWINKENDKQEEADSLSYSTTSHTQHLYQISKS